MTKSNRKRIPDSELALIENGIALQIEAVEHLHRASLSTRNPETLGGILGAVQALGRLREMLLDWKKSRIGDSDQEIPAAITESHVVDSLDRSLTALEETFKCLSDLRHHIEARSIIEGDEVKNENDI